MIDLVLHAPDLQTLAAFARNRGLQVRVGRIIDEDPDSPTFGQVLEAGEWVNRRGFEYTPWAGSGKFMRTKGTYDNEVVFHQWQFDSNNRISARVATNSTKIGDPFFEQAALGVSDLITGEDDTFTPGINVPFNIASRHGFTFINGAIDGTALTADTTPTSLPYLENTDMQIGSTFNGTIKLFRMWADDLKNEGIAEASA